MEKLQEFSSVSSASSAAVASDHPVCSQFGLSILVEGGNAIDATLATALCLGIANPASSGIGGGAFLLIHKKKKKKNVTTTQEEEHNPQQQPHRRDRRDIPFEDARDEPPSSNDDDDDDDGNHDITELIDCREVAPLAATTDMFLDQPDDAASLLGGLAVAVPGELRGLELAHARHGGLPWEHILDKVIALARRGVVVSAHLAESIAEKQGATWKTGKPEFEAIGRLLTLRHDGLTPLRPGDRYQNPGLVRALRLIRDAGSDAVYSNRTWVARDIVGAVRRAGGILSLRDLQRYRPVLRTPLRAVVRDTTWIGAPPPSSGGAAVIGAGRFLSGYRSSPASQLTTLQQHRLAEALKHVFAIRMSLSDPKFQATTNREAVRDLVESGYVEGLRQNTSDEHVLPLSHYGGPKWAQLKDREDTEDEEAQDAHEGDRRKQRRRQRRRLEQRWEQQKERRQQGKRRLYDEFGYLEDHGTSHLSVVDKDGNAVSMTSTVNTYFGSNIVAPKSGIILNSEMDDFGNPGKPNYFGLEPSEDNFIKPGKRPLSSMSPMMVFQNTETSTSPSNSNPEEEKDPQLVLVLGASGGPKIITSVLQVIINFCWLGMSLFDSISHPRIHDQLLYHSQTVTAVEDSTIDVVIAEPNKQQPQPQEYLQLNVSNATRNALKRRGHRLLSIDYTGTVQAIGVDLETQTLMAACDIRKGGAPAGY